MDKTSPRRTSGPPSGGELALSSSGWRHPGRGAGQRVLADAAALALDLALPLDQHLEGHPVQDASHGGRGQVQASRMGQVNGSASAPSASCRLSSGGTNGPSRAATMSPG